MLFTILTPTIGSIHLKTLLFSINQLMTHDQFEIEHLVVIDGPVYESKAKQIMKEIEPRYPRHVCVLPYNTGDNHYLGHKIYASMSQLVNGNYVLFMDEDNSMDPVHVWNYYQRIEQSPSMDWLYCLRKIMNSEGTMICKDNCESLGYLHHAFYHEQCYFIDTNCMCIRKDILIQLSPIYNRVGMNNDQDPDRIMSRTLMKLFPKFQCTKQHTVNYRTSNRENSVSSDLFVRGNQWMHQKFPSGIPWDSSSAKKDLFIVHFDPSHTKEILHRIYSSPSPKPSVSFHQWQLNLLDNFDLSELCIYSGYNPYIPSNTTILCHMCDPSQLPLSVLQSRKDVYRILLTIESPNIRHQRQWTREFLEQYFDHVLTYWEDIVFQGTITYSPFLYRLDLHNPNDLRHIVDINDMTPLSRTICMILENRPFSETYHINSTQLQALDFLREKYAILLGKSLYCYGNTWESFKDIVHVCPTLSRMENREFVHDLMKPHTFVLIIENCNARGYVSEKLYDAWVAGCIPLYYGNINSQMRNIIPDNTYIDLRQIQPHELNSFLQTVSIREYLQTIERERMTIFSKVSTNHYATLCSSLLK